MSASEVDFSRHQLHADEVQGVVTGAHLLRPLMDLFQKGPKELKETWESLTAAEVFQERPEKELTSAIRELQADRRAYLGGSVVTHAGRSAVTCESIIMPVHGYLKENEPLSSRLERVFSSEDEFVFPFLLSGNDSLHVSSSFIHDLICFFVVSIIFGFQPTISFVYLQRIPFVSIDDFFPWIIFPLLSPSIALPNSTFFPPSHHAFIHSHPFCFPPVSTTARDDVRKAVRILYKERMGAVAVSQIADRDGNTGGLAGIFTSTDYVNRVLAKELSPRDVAIEDVMTPFPVTVTPNYTLSQIGEIMAQKDRKHLPLLSFLGDSMDNDSRVTDVITWRDLYHAARATTHDYYTTYDADNFAKSLK